MTEKSVGDQPRFTAHGVVGDVVIPHHIERIGAGFAVVGYAQTVGSTSYVLRGLVASDVCGFIEWDELSLA